MMDWYEILEKFPEGAIQGAPDRVEGESIEQALETWGRDYADACSDHPLHGGVRVRARKEGDQEWKWFTVTGEYELNVFVEEDEGGQSTASR